MSDESPFSDESCIIFISSISIRMTTEGKMSNPFQRAREGEYVPKRVPEYECEFKFIKGSGAGGQKVNKTSSTAELRWSIGRSSTFSEDEKKQLRFALASRVTQADEIVIQANEQRSQLQNKYDALERLNKMVADALKPVKARVEGRPTRGSQMRRLEGKAKDSVTKRGRRESFGGEE